MKPDNARKPSVVESRPFQPPVTVSQAAKMTKTMVIRARTKAMAPRCWAGVGEMMLVSAQVRAVPMAASS